MVLKKGVGFSLNESFPLDKDFSLDKDSSQNKSFSKNKNLSQETFLFQERLYEAIFSVESQKEEAFIKELERLGLPYIFLGETKQESSLKLKSSSFSLKKLQDSYFKTWNDLSL